jgi:hypothetical protein
LTTGTFGNAGADGLRRWCGVARLYNLPAPGTKEESQKETKPTVDARTVDQKMRAHAVAVASDILVLDDKFLQMTSEGKVYAIVELANPLYLYVKLGVNEQ